MNTNNLSWRISGVSLVARIILSFALFLVALTLCTTTLCNAQSLIPRSVIGGGATNSINDRYGVVGTLSQSAIGRLSAQSTKHNVGFWYTVQQLLGTDPNAALLVVPNAHAAPGERVSIPLVLQQSKNLLSSGVKSFSAVLRFNATLLEPLDKTQYTRVNDTGWVRVNAAINDSAGILATTEFVAKLGNNENTTVEIESFVFNEAKTIRSIKKNGVFSLDGVCREGGQVRLLKYTKATMLRMYPNPVEDKAEIQALLSERGETTIYLVDMRGVTLTTFFTQEVEPSVLSLSVNVAALPSGNYFLMMRTPNEVFSQKIIIKK